MKCPICPDSELAMTDRQGIEIDYCPKCRGVWLDRGELDKLVDRAATVTPGPAGAPPRRDSPGPDYHRDAGYERGRHKKSWLSDIFD